MATTKEALQVKKVDKTQETLERWCAAPGIEFLSAAAKAAYKKRARRIADAIQLKVPDRVPIVPGLGMFPALDNGFTCEDVMFDGVKARAAWLKTLADFEPDQFSAFLPTGPTLEAMDYKLIKLPGRGVPANHNFQVLEWEYIPAEEFYDAFLNDPSDFMLRVYLPRVCGVLEPLKRLSPWSEWLGYSHGILGNVPAFGTPEVAGALEALIKAGTIAAQQAETAAATAKQILARGFPSGTGLFTSAPFDVIGDWFRGTRGVMLDMYRRPDKLLQAMEKLVPIMIRMGLKSKRAGQPFVFMPLHKGSEGFMSLEQYKTFYWPTLRKVMMGLIDEGLVPQPFFEGENTSRLEIIRDIPRGKALYKFDEVNLHKAKEVLGDTVCFRGNVPASLMCTGTPEAVKAYVKKLIDVVGRGGGLMVDCGAGCDEGKHENVKAMVDFTKEYGVYR